MLLKCNERATKHPSPLLFDCNIRFYKHFPMDDKFKFCLRAGASPPSTSPPPASPMTPPSPRSASTRPSSRGNSPTPAKASSSSKLTSYIFTFPLHLYLCWLPCFCKIRANSSWSQLWSKHGNFLAAVIPSLAVVNFKK